MNTNNMTMADVIEDLKKYVVEINGKKVIKQPSLKQLRELSGNKNFGNYIFDNGKETIYYNVDEEHNSEVICISKNCQTSNGKETNEVN